MDKTKSKHKQRNTHRRGKSEAYALFNYNTTKSVTPVRPFIDDSDNKSTKSDERSKPKPVITKLGFNMSDASLDDKMNYL